MTEDKTYTISPPKQINDQRVLGQLPVEVTAALGVFVGSGYDLDKSERDIEFEHGLVLYNPAEPEVTVRLDQFND